MLAESTGATGARFTLTVTEVTPIMPRQANGVVNYAVIATKNGRTTRYQTFGDSLQEAADVVELQPHEYAGFTRSDCLIPTRATPDDCRQVLAAILRYQGK